MPSHHDYGIAPESYFGGTPDDGPSRETSGFPKIVCFCGSTRFKREFIEANFRETMAGKIVLSIGWFSHADAQVYTPTAEEKAVLDQLHLRKVELADELLVINPGGYIGESTAREIAHAREMGKPIRYLEPPR